MVRANSADVSGRLHGYEVSWHYRTTNFSKCKDVIIEIAPANPQGDRLVTAWRMVYPVGASRVPISSDVPAEIAQDYREACNVLPISAKASAAFIQTPPQEYSS